MSQTQYVYCVACGQTYYTTRTDACALCGKVGSITEPDSLRSIVDLRDRKRTETNTKKLYDVLVTFWGRVLRMVLAGSALILFVVGTGGTAVVLWAIHEEKWWMMDASTPILVFTPMIFASIVLALFAVLAGRKCRIDPDIETTLDPANHTPR